ncbi:MAG: response regulator [Oscillospiraceae bacterium]|jgi:putative two-component system response regulator|nr:response regulator [Oscillospiraceae bacterium]
MGKPRTVAIVDDNISTLKIGRSILADTYGTFTLPSAEKMFELLERVTPDLILLDIEMPDLDGYEAIKRLKASPRTSEIPVIFLTARNGSQSELSGLELGAVDYITKPFSPALLLKRIELHLKLEEQNRQLKRYNDNLQEIIREKTNNVHELQEAVMKTMANLVEYRDNFTGGHAERSGRVLNVLLEGAELEGLYQTEIRTWDKELFLQSSHLHDVGKIAIRDEILLKPGRLSVEEFEIMKKHTALGVDIINNIQMGSSENSIAFLDYARILAGSHHEKWDGSGYPNKLKGEEIPLQGRFMAIADVYDALVSYRPYKPALSHDDALEIIRDSVGLHFDPNLVRVFLANADKVQAVEYYTLNS